MFKNYIITAWRNLMRNKIFSFINITGLSTGIVSCILIFLYMQDELSYDRHWKHAGRIMKINWEETTNGVTDPYGEVAFGTGASLKENLPEVEATVRILTRNNLTVSRDGKYFNEDAQYSVDSNFLSVFSFELLAGDARTCLSEPNSVVISEAMAGRFFGNAPPLGKELQYPDGLYKVTGVLKNSTEKSHLKPNALVSFNYKNESMKEMLSSLLWLNTYTYVKLKNEISVYEFDKKLSQWRDKMVMPALKEGNVGYKVELKSLPVTGVHFDNYHKDPFEKADKNYVYIFGWIAAFILLIACFNYMNLSTARASSRSREVGVRKAAGASRRQLIMQFLGESLILSCIALIIAIGLLVFLLPFFNTLTGKNMQPAGIFSNNITWAIIAAIILFISLVGGSYPAFYLSSFQPVSVLKGRLHNHKKASFLSNISLRQLLVISQFTISGVVIICTIMVYSQLKLMKNKDLGFNKDQVLVLKFPWLDSLNNAKAIAFKNAISNDPMIKKVAGASQVIGAGGNILFRIKNENKTSQASLNISSIDYQYLDLLNIKLAQGRNFSKDYGTDENSFILNETAVKFLRLKDPLNAELSMNDSTFGKVIGVVKDYNYKSPHSKIEPLVFTLDNQGYFAFLKLSPQNTSQSIDHVSVEWQKFFPHNPISYYFLDEKFNTQYKSEDTMLTLFACFSALTIFISCMGLFGLAAFITGQRKKEIGIRKVVGASVANIVYQVSKDFLLMVVVAIVIASPLAYYFISDWLQHFAYKVDIGLWVFAATGFVTLVVAFLTMSLQTIRAANANPIKSLRTE